MNQTNRLQMVPGCYSGRLWLYIVLSLSIKSLNLKCQLAQFVLVAIIWCCCILVCFRLMTLCESSVIVLVAEMLPNVCVCAFLYVYVCLCVWVYVDCGRKRWISEQRTGALPVCETPTHCRWAKLHPFTCSASWRVDISSHCHCVCQFVQIAVICWFVEVFLSAVSIYFYSSALNAWLNININLSGATTLVTLWSFKRENLTSFTVNIIMYL